MSTQCWWWDLFCPTSQWSWSRRCVQDIISQQAEETDGNWSCCSGLAGDILVVDLRVRNLKDMWTHVKWVNRWEPRCQPRVLSSWLSCSGCLSNIKGAATSGELKWNTTTLISLCTTDKWPNHFMQDIAKKNTGHHALHCDVMICDRSNFHFALSCDKM